MLERRARRAWGGRHPDTGGGQLYRERKAVEADAYFGNSRGVIAGNLKVGLDSLRSFDEEADSFILSVVSHLLLWGLGCGEIGGAILFEVPSIGHSEERHGILALSVNSEDNSAGDEHFEVGRGFDEGGNLGSSGNNLLEIVEDEKEALVFEIGLEGIDNGGAGDLLDTEGFSNSGGDEPLLLGREGSELYEPDAIGILREDSGPYLQSEAGFTSATGAGEGDNVDVGAANEGDNSLYLFSTTDKGGDLAR